MELKVLQQEKLSKYGQEFNRVICSIDVDKLADGKLTQLEDFADEGPWYIAGGYASWFVSQHAKLLFGGEDSTINSYGDIDIYLSNPKRGSITQPVGTDIQIIRKNPAFRITKAVDEKFGRMSLGYKRMHELLTAEVNSFEDHVLKTLACYDLVLSQAAMCIIDNLLIIYYSAEYQHAHQCHEATTMTDVFAEYMSDVANIKSKPYTVPDYIYQHLGISISRILKYKRRVEQSLPLTGNQMYGCTRILIDIRDRNCMTIYDPANTGPFALNESYKKQWKRLSKDLFDYFSVNTGTTHAYTLD